MQIDVTMLQDNFFYVRLIDMFQHFLFLSKLMLQEVGDEVVMIMDSQEFPTISEEVIVIDDDSDSSENNTTVVIKDDTPTTPCSSYATTVTANGGHKR